MFGRIWPGICYVLQRIGNGKIAVRIAGEVVYINSAGRQMYP